MNEAIQHPDFRPMNRITTRKRARRDRIIATIITAACLVAIGIGIGIYATLYVTGFTW
jgi:uncharacterized BrkB/YihY/UPF0761 family membrane protein